MKCPKCQFENVHRANFCNECGCELKNSCAVCSKINPPGSKFCNECGHNLDQPIESISTELSFDDKLIKIQKYLPKGLTEKILSQKDRIEGERKQVTVMFCDMVGFTSLSEKIGIEETYTIMDHVYEILIHKVHDYGGTVNEMTGDGIMALFGAPIALEDAPQRAVRSSLSIHREMIKFNEKMKQDKKDIPLLKMRVGIHSGPVVVGTLGNDLRVDFKAVGDTVNLASRVEGLAEPGTTYVTKDIFKYTTGLFRFEAFDEQEIKGKKETVRTYRVVAPSTRRTRFDVSAEQGLTPLVGRERELELLLDGYERSKAGRGQAFSLVGEAGVGKSRLLYEFRKAIAHEDVTFLEGKCLSYGRKIPYHPIIDILKSTFNILDDDLDATVIEKVKSGLGIMKVDEISSLPYLLNIFSVKNSGIDKIPMSPEERKDRIIEAVKHNILKGSEIRTLILAIEDLHWIDKSSEEILRGQLESLMGARIFMVLTYRPEYVLTWGGKSYHNQLNLNRLSNRESLLMVKRILRAGEIERDLENLILDKTEGIPFFIEEFIESLKDLKIVDSHNGEYFLVKDIQDVIVPTTIQDVIMSRVDSLPESAKKVLQTGSIIEREFSHELLKKVIGQSEHELLSNLSILKDTELLFERGIYPQSSYIFKHALTQEVVYDSILSERKKKLHIKICNAIEALHKDNLEEYFGVLAQRYTDSEHFEMGSHYSKLAAQKALKAGLLHDAIDYAKKRVFCVEKFPLTDSNQLERIDARATLSGYCASLSLFSEAKKAVVPIADVAVKLNYQRRLPAINTSLGIYTIYVEEDFPKAYQYLAEVLKIADKVGDFVSFGFTLYYLGCSLSLNCQFDEGLEHYDKLLELCKLADNQVAVSNTESSKSAFNHIFQGKIEIAHKVAKESLRIARETDDIYAKGMAYSSYGIACYINGQFEEAEGHLLQGLAFCDKIKLGTWQSYSALWLGEMYVDNLQFKKAQEYYLRAISAFEPDGYLPSFLNFFELCIDRAKVFNKEKTISFDELIKYYDNIKFKVFNGWIARHIAEVLIKVDYDNLSATKEWIKKAIKDDEREGLKWFLGKDYVLYAEFFNRKGNPIKANDYKNKAINIFRECGATGWVEKYEKELAEI
jgi:class 3 adenylate cyclase/tetratricopeptide (TPR) repeat protein